MYRVYLRNHDSQVYPESKTNTQSQQAALNAFCEIVNRTELDDQKLAAVLSYNNRQLAFHRFDRNPGDVDYWRDKLDEIDLPQVGAPVVLDGGKRVNVYLDAESLKIASDLGKGNVSEGIRISLQRSTK
jgi:hypothetical protein